MTDVLQLIDKRRTSGLLLDTNLLLLYVIGRTNPNRIAKFKRTQPYTSADFAMLERFVAEFRVLITTPHVLTELSNLGNLHGQEREVLGSMFVSIVEESREHYDESRLVVKESCFRRLGLTDAAVVALARHDYLFLTDDFDLYSTLVSHGANALNFNHLRSRDWQF
jgi:predicted nucleic acid-binding protein